MSGNDTKVENMSAVLFRCTIYLPKEVSIENFSASEVCAFANSINNLPRKILQYETPKAIFHRFLDSVMTK